MISKSASTKATKINSATTRNNKWHCVINSPLGKIGLRLDVTGETLLSLDFLPANTKLITPKSAFAKKIIRELASYFRSPKFKFSIPLIMPGTLLQQKIWQELRQIPSGDTLTYGSLAKKMATSPRVIGNACRSNPFPIIVPCHRIVSANGIGGYSGARSGRWLEIKKWLLHHENQNRKII